MPSVLLLLVYACSNQPVAPASSGSRLSITDVRADSVASGADVHFVVENTGGKVLYLSRCGERIESAVDRWEGDEWKLYSSDDCLAMYPTDLVLLDPGEDVTSSRTLTSPGRYRLRVGVTRNSRWRVVWDVTSEPFTIPE